MRSLSRNSAFSVVGQSMMEAGSQMVIMSPGSKRWQILLQLQILSHSALEKLTNSGAKIPQKQSLDQTKLARDANSIILFITESASTISLENFPEESEGHRRYHSAIATKLLLFDFLPPSNSRGRPNIIGGKLVKCTLVRNSTT